MDKDHQCMVVAALTVEEAPMEGIGMVPMETDRRLMEVGDIEEGEEEAMGMAEVDAAADLVVVAPTEEDMLPGRDIENSISSSGDASAFQVKKESLTIVKGLFKIIGILLVSFNVLSIAIYGC